MSNLIYEDECYRIRGAIFEVHNEMGNGFLEGVYQECLEREFTKSGIPFASEVKLKIAYKGEPLKLVYEPDLICFDKIIVELKAVSVLSPVHRAQVINYLKATGLRVGLLVNFGAYPQVKIERFVL